MKLYELQQLAQKGVDLQGLQQQQWLHRRMTELGMDPNTIYQELEMTSRFVDTHRDTSYSNAQMQLHSHSFYELLYCINSCGAEYLVGSERYRLRKGDIVFVPPGVSHRPMLPDSMAEPYERYVLWMSTEFMEWYARLVPRFMTEREAQVSLLRTGGTGWEYVGELFRAGVQESEQRMNGWEAAVIGNTIQLLTQIKRAFDGKTAPTVKAERPALLERIVTYVENNYARPIAIGELAEQFFVSGSTISHLFQQKLGVSFYRYVTQRRLIAAKTLIERGLRLEEVAAQTGFADYSSFYRAFKQAYGISPRQYRTIQETEPQ